MSEFLTVGTDTEKAFDTNVEVSTISTILYNIEILHYFAITNNDAVMSRVGPSPKFYLNLGSSRVRTLAHKNWIHVQILRCDVDGEGE